MTASDLARAYAEALDRGNDAVAAGLMAEDVQVVFPHGTIRGRDAWLELRAQRPPAEHIEERVEGVDVVETEEGAELRGTLVQRWVETGEVASEQPIRVAFAVVDGRIRRIELSPGG